MAINAPIAEEDQVVTLSGSLPSSYSTLVTALEARDTISLSYVRQSLIREEQKLKRDSKLDGSMDAGAGRALFQHKKVCYLCGEPGHFRWDCPKNRSQKFSKSKHKAKPVSTESREGSHSDTESDEEAFYGVSSQSYNSGGWRVDSGASSHMTQSRQFLVDYEGFDKPQKVCLADGRTVEVFGRGNIHFRMVFKMSKPKEVTMDNALYVPKLACNLFSVRAAATKGNSVKFGNSKCWIHGRNGKLLGM